MQYHTGKRRLTFSQQNVTVEINEHSVRKKAPQSTHNQKKDFKKHALNVGELFCRLLFTAKEKTSNAIHLRECSKTSTILSQLLKISASIISPTSRRFADRKQTSSKKMEYRNRVVLKYLLIYTQPLQAHTHITVLLHHQLIPYTTTRCYWTDLQITFIGSLEKMEPSNISL